MNEKLIKLFHKTIEDFCYENNITQIQAMAFLSECLIGTMAMHGYSEKFANKTFDRFNDKFKNHPKRNI